MGSFKHPHVFDPLDLEIIDHVYEAAWARVEANEPDRDRTLDDARREALRQWVFALAEGHPVEFDALCERLEKMPTSWLLTVARGKSGSRLRDRLLGSETGRQKVMYAQLRDRSAALRAASSDSFADLRWRALRFPHARFWKADV